MGSADTDYSLSPHVLNNVFVYGSLLADEVVEILLKRVPKSSPAILYHFHRFNIKGRIYPAILPVENEKVTGRVLLDISGHELHVLDTFEDVEYKRRTVEVSLKDGCENMKVSAYVWGTENDSNLYGDWNFEEWKKVHMVDFKTMTSNFIEETRLPDCNKSRVDTYDSFFPQYDNVNPSTS